LPTTVVRMVITLARRLLLLGGAERPQTVAWVAANKGYRPSAKERSMSAKTTVVSPTAMEVVGAPAEVVYPTGERAQQVIARPPATAAVRADRRTRPGDDDFLPIQGVEYVEYWVGNAHQAAHYYRALFGFDIVAYAGPETGVRDRACYVLRQGEITWVFTAALRPDEQPSTREAGAEDVRGWSSAGEIAQRV